MRSSSIFIVSYAGISEERIDKSFTRLCAKARAMPGVTHSLIAYGEQSKANARPLDVPAITKGRPFKFLSFVTVTAALEPMPLR